MISKEKIYELVEVFYQPTFKTFYVNSVDGKSFVKPLGVFVSLGITTSKRVIEEIKDIISNTSEYSAIISEISSKRVGNQYLNTLINTNDPDQYKLSEENYSSGVLNEQEAKEELKRLKSLLSLNNGLDAMKEAAPKAARLQNLIEKLDSTSGWDSHLIQEDNSSDYYKIYHKYVNYKKEGDIEYRIGIYVSEVN